jgi:hypothetical protein
MNKQHIAKMLHRLVIQSNIDRENHVSYVAQYQDMKLFPVLILQDQHGSMLDIAHYANKTNHLFILNNAKKFFTEVDVEELRPVILQIMH